MTTKKTHRSGAAIQDALAKAITARLDNGVENLPHEISERLKLARTQAVAKRKLVAEAATSHTVVGNGSQASLSVGSGFHSLWTQLGSWLPLLALVTGMVVIGVAQDEWVAQEIADVDSELLTDALPPAAYTDPGFAQFLRNNQEK